MPSPGEKAVRSFRVDSLSVRVCADRPALARDAAEMAHEYLTSVLTRQGQAAVILATGNSQIQFLENLVGLGGIDWSKVTLFHMDEYLGIDANHTASFRRYMTRNYLRILTECTWAAVILRNMRTSCPKMSRCCGRWFVLLNLVKRFTRNAEG